MRCHLRFLMGAVIGLALASGADAVVNIQNLGAGARSASLGNAFVAVADNGDAMFANPAGLATLSGRQLAYTNVSLLHSGLDDDDLGQHVVSLTQPLGGRLALGVGYERIGSDQMSENGAFLGLGYRLSRDLQLGLTGKYVFWQVAAFDSNDPVSGQSAGSVGADVGLLWRTPFRGARLGVQLKNALQPNATCDCAANGASLASGAGDLPMDLSVGLSHRRDQMLLSVQWTVRDVGGEGSESRLVVGGETSLVEGLMLRAGGSRIFEEDAQGDLNAGLGYRWKKMLFDYGYHIPLDLAEANGSHRFSLAWQL
jgi:hypothetical protein